MSLHTVGKRLPSRSLVGTEITDLHRRLSYLTSAIDETLERNGVSNAVLRQQQPSTNAAQPLPQSSKHESSEILEPVPVPLRSQRQSRSRSQRSVETKDDEVAHEVTVTTAQTTDVPIVSGFSLAAFASKRQRNDATSTTESQQGGSSSETRLLAATVTPLEVPVSGSLTKQRRIMSPTGEFDSVPARRARSPTIAPKEVTATSDAAPSSLAALRKEEEALKARIEVLRRMEEERRTLLDHQLRVSALEEQRRRLSSASRDTDGRSPQHQPLLPPKDTSQGTSHRSLERGVSVAQTVLGEPLTDVLHPSNNGVIHSSGRSASPNAHNPQYDFRNHQTPPPTTSLSVGNGLFPRMHAPTPDQKRRTSLLPQGHASPGYPGRGVEDLNPDEGFRWECLEAMSQDGVEGEVLTGATTSTRCRFFIRGDSLGPMQQGVPVDPLAAQPELLAVPLNSAASAADGSRRTETITERHHFPLRDGAVLYPNGIVQHRWPPERVHLRGVLTGNKARSVLLAKGCPFAADTVSSDVASLNLNRCPARRLYLMVGGDPYHTDATLLVLQLHDRPSFLRLLLGIHAVLWPHGKPPMTRGRALWMLLCHHVLLQHWSANDARETIFSQRKRELRRSASREPPLPPAAPYETFRQRSGSGNEQPPVPLSLAATPPRHGSFPTALQPQRYLDVAVHAPYDDAVAMSDDVSEQTEDTAASSAAAAMHMHRGAPTAMHHSFGSTASQHTTSSRFGVPAPLPVRGHTTSTASRFGLPSSVTSSSRAARHHQPNHHAVTTVPNTATVEGAGWKSTAAANARPVPTNYFPRAVAQGGLPAASQVASLKGRAGMFSYGY